MPNESKQRELKVHSDDMHSSTKHGVNESANRQRNQNTTSSKHHALDNYTPRAIQVHDVLMEPWTTLSQTETLPAQDSDLAKTSSLKHNASNPGVQDCDAKIYNASFTKQYADTFLSMPYPRIGRRIESAKKKKEA